MIDRLEIVYGGLPWWQTAAYDGQLPVLWTETRPISQYRRAWLVYPDSDDRDHLLTLACDPIHPRAAQTKVVVNQKHPSFPACRWWRVLQHHYPEAVLGQWRVNRIDLTVDVARVRPIDLAGAVRDNNARKWNAWAASGYWETIYSGDDPKIRIYDKGLEAGGAAGALGRVEIQARDKTSWRPQNLRDLYERGRSVLRDGLARTLPLASATEALSPNQRLMNVRRLDTVSAALARAVIDDETWHDDFCTRLWEATGDMARAYCSP